MARKRDYKAEYAKRIARGIASGKSRAQARGHGEAKRLNLADDRVAFARSLEAQGYSKTKAAKEAHISTERYAALHRRGFEPRGRKFVIPAVGEGEIEVNVDDATAKHLSGFLKAFNDVRKSGGVDQSALEPYDNDVITDLEGVPHTLDITYHPDEIDDYKYEPAYS